MGLMNHPGTCSGRPGTIPETSQGSPKALLRLSKLPEQVTSQQSPGSSHQAATSKDLKMGCGDRRPNIYTYATAIIVCVCFQTLHLDLLNKQKTNLVRDCAHTKQHYA